MWSVTFVPIREGADVEDVDWAITIISVLGTGVVTLGAVIWRRMVNDIAALEKKLDDGLASKANRESTDKRFDDTIALLRSHADVHNGMAADISEIKSSLAYIRGRMEREDKK